MIEIMLWNFPPIKTQYEEIQKAMQRISQLHVCNLPKAYFSGQPTINTNGRRVHFFVQNNFFSLTRTTNLAFFCKAIDAMLDTWFPRDSDPQDLQGSILVS